MARTARNEAPALGESRRKRQLPVTVCARARARLYQVSHEPTPADEGGVPAFRRFEGVQGKSNTFGQKHISVVTEGDGIRSRIGGRTRTSRVRLRRP
jgi:hypothetical protein